MTTIRRLLWGNKTYMLLAAGVLYEFVDALMKQDPNAINWAVVWAAAIGAAMRAGISKSTSPEAAKPPEAKREP